MKIQISNVLLMMSILILGGCGIQDTKTVRATKDFYFTHVNRPMKLNLENVKNLDESNRLLAAKFNKLDRELTALTRAMDSVLDPTKQAAVAELLNTFPWLSNVYVLDAETSILGAIPSVAPASVSFSYLIDKEILPRELYAHVISDNNNPHFLIARPYIQSGTLVGYLAVSFDPKSLLYLVGDASSIFIRTLDDVLWTGDLYLPDTPLAELDWTSIIDQRSFGKISRQGLRAEWFVRYYANFPVIFGIVEK